MKKFILITLVLFSLMVWGAEEKLLISFSGRFLTPADGNYKEIYGKSVLAPEVQVAYGFAEKWYAFGGYGFFSKNGETPELKEKCKSLQSYFSLGAGHKGIFSEKFGYFAQAGAVLFSYKEEALDTTIKGSAIGFRVGGGVKFKLVKRFSLVAAVGYLNASDKADSGDGITTNLKLGGFHFGAGFELNLI